VKVWAEFRGSLMDSRSNEINPAPHGRVSRRSLDQSLSCWKSRSAANRVPPIQRRKDAPSRRANHQNHPSLAGGLRRTHAELAPARVGDFERFRNPPVPREGASHSYAQRPIDPLNRSVRPEQKVSGHGGWSAGHQTEQSCPPTYQVPANL